MTHIASLFLLFEAEEQKRVQHDPRRMLPAGVVKPSTCASLITTSAQSGGNYRFSKPEVNAVHFHQREGLQRGLLPDFNLHAVADVSGPNHLEGQSLAPWRWNEGTPEVYAVSD